MHTVRASKGVAAPRAGREQEASLKFSSQCLRSSLPVTARLQPFTFLESSQDTPRFYGPAPVTWAELRVPR